MTDDQFSDFMKKFYRQFDIVMDQKKTEIVDELKEHFDTRYKEQDSKIDWIIDALDTEEKERLATSASTDRRLDNHDRRLAKLELATN